MKQKSVLVSFPSCNGTLPKDDRNESKFSREFEVDSEVRSRSRMLESCHPGSSRALVPGRLIGIGRREQSRVVGDGVRAISKLLRRVILPMSTLLVIELPNLRLPCCNG